jgi:hypothetical protein
VFLVKTPAAWQGTSEKMPPKSNVPSFIPMFLPNQENPGTILMIPSIALPPKAVSLLVAIICLFAG